MAITVKKTSLWRKELDNEPGTLAGALAPLAESGTNLQLVMLYRFRDTHQGAVEVYPIAGKKSTNVARKIGLSPSSVPVLLVEGDNRAGLGFQIAKAVSDSGINVSFLMAQVVGRKYAAIFGFQNDNDAAKASTLIKRAAAPTRKR
ncbi:MAG TPA: hypothetical protein VJ728_01230 [Candidatus Binataceae bacterium]|nr:hypothetical protein [Candidatus Binataceae bacterium]